MQSGIVAEEPANSQGGSRLGHILNMDLFESDVERIQMEEYEQTNVHTRFSDPVPETLNISHGQQRNEELTGNNAHHNPGYFSGRAGEADRSRPKVIGGRGFSEDRGQSSKVGM